MSDDKRQPGLDFRVPQDAALRRRIEQTATALVRRYQVTPPVPLETLRRLAEEIVAAIPAATDYADYTIIMLHNAAWYDVFSQVPFRRRILLLPPCLRNQSVCRATADPLGLVCGGCAACPISSLGVQAEALGYTVMIADSASVAKDLIQEDLVEAVLGVSCMDTLEKIFPELDREAIPGLAVPLLRCGCRDTTVDTEILSTLIHTTSQRPPPVSVKKTNEKVRSLFTSAPDPLRSDSPSATGKIVGDYLATSGKRWRPTLLVAVFEALTETPHIPEGVETLALAIECFHKASLIHDDIEDADTLRDGHTTLHIRYGQAVAINAGDYLLGEGYRLIAKCGFSAHAIRQMLDLVATGHRDLSVGQGEELLATPTSPEAHIEIFRKKTSPAFRIPIQLGIVCAAETRQTDSRTLAAMLDVAEQYSDALGIAYQLHDNMKDGDSPLDNIPILLDTYRQRALDSLAPLTHAGLKILLARITNHLLR